MAGCTVNEFFNRDNVDEFHGKLNPLLVDLFRSGSSICFEIDYKNNSVLWNTKDKSSSNDLVIMSGGLPQGVSTRKLSAVGNNAFLPFLLAISKVEIPHSKLYFLGRNDKSMSEFLLRNIAANIAAQSHFLISLDRSAMWGRAVHVRLLERYFWYFKGLLVSEKHISNISIERFLSACFLRVKELDENPKLCADLDVIRSIVSPTQLTLVDQLLIVRDEVMHQCHS